MVKIGRIIVSVLGVFLWLAAATPTQDQPRHPIEIAVFNTAKIVYTATYKTITGDDVVDQGAGTGILIAPNRVLTCYHLVVNYQPGTFAVFITDGKSVFSRKNEEVKIIKSDKLKDLLLLEVTPPFNETGVSVAAKSPRLGEPIFFTGYTLLPVSTMRFSQYNENNRGIMLYPVYRGDSGGGVFNTKGELVGIINCVLLLKEGGVQFPTFIGYAMPLDVIQGFLK